MAERLHPGVYVEEVSSGVRPIEGVSTSTAAFIGETARGIPALAQFVTGFGDFDRLFGGHQPAEAGFLASAVDGFFAAGGRRAYVVRVLPVDAVKGQGEALGTRSNPAVQALQFVARGAGKWADAIRISIGEASNFKADAFRIDVLWTQDGASRRVESFDDVRMDPSHEDYVGERLKTSKYVEVVDLFARTIDADPSKTVVAAEPPSLRARPVEAAGTYTMYEDKELAVSWWDAAQPEPVVHSQKVKFDAALLATLAAPKPEFKDGSAKLTAAQLSKLLHDKLTLLEAPEAADPPSIGFTIGKPAQIVLIPPAAGVDTWDLGGEAVSVTVNGGAAQPVTVTAADLATTTAAELAAALNNSGAGVRAVVTAPRTVTVTGQESLEKDPTLAIAVAPTAAAVNAVATDGKKGIFAERLGGMRLTLSESVTPTAPAVLRALGFPGNARGYAANSPANPGVRPAARIGLRLTGGSDGKQAIVPSDFEGDARERTGLHALDGVDVNIVALPGKNDTASISLAIAYCDKRGDCFYVVDGPGGADRQVEVKPDDAKQFIEALPARSKNSAMFYPWIQVPDPVGVGRNPTRFVPPSGHVAGIFARTDVTRGVWKAPAGIEATVAEAVGLQYYVLDAEQDLLNPVSLNCLRQLPGVGIVSWGTRTLSSDPEWRYVPVRRMGLFLKESLRRGLQWAVFEPNDAELWGRIAINITSFMMTLFRQGAFQGATPGEAFAVVCDRSTNPQENVDAGIVTAKVAFAPLKPAEFVVIEISQKSLLVA
jgi:phage tail sheath protein FI